ncbi:hypothetical protein [Crossiella sp. CA198]|uniref:hypothetical protein n=1 Tax=Crossiella sp. CA198 TaxID=3455607 RepID=UPI003F8D5E95
MAEQRMPLPPLLLDGAEYHADPIRRALSALAGDRAGRFAPGDLAAAMGSDYTMTVTPGRASVPAPADGTGGVYLVESAAPVTLAVTPPHATRDRIDRLVAYVVPAQAGGTPGAWYLAVREGEPAASPVPPAVGAALVLYDLWVHSAASGRPIELSDMRLSGGQQMLAGGTLAGAERPATAPAGTVWTSTTTRQSWAYSGTAWRLLGVQDDTLASHALSGSRAWGPGVNEQAVDNLTFGPGRNGGLIELSAGVVHLSRPGRWALSMQAFSDDGTPGSSKVWLDWPGGPWLTRDLCDTRMRGGGFAGAGVLHQPISWTGVVTSDQALNAITIRGAFTPSTGGNRPSYMVWLYVDYLGR